MDDRTRLDLEVELARDATTGTHVFTILADLAEEAGQPEEVCAAIRGLEAVALEIKATLTRLLAEAPTVFVHSVQVNSMGGYWIWPSDHSRLPDSWGPEHLRGHSPSLRTAVEQHDALLAGLDALGVYLGFAVLERQRTTSGEVLSFGFFHR